MVFFLLASVSDSTRSGSLDLYQVFQGAPWIYSTLLILSIISLIVWLYSLLTMRSKDLMPKDFINHVREMFTEHHFEAALSVCQQEKNFSSAVIASGLEARKYGPQMMREAMQAEGKRSGTSLWQRIFLLNEIAFISPLIGLLGTVLGIFFAFYDTSRTNESLSAMFDGLGMAVGTTVAGLLVAILAMIFASILKFRLIKIMNQTESELLSLVHLVEFENGKNS